MRIAQHKGRVHAGGVHIGYNFTRSKLASLAFYAGVAVLVLALWRVQQHMFAANYVESFQDDLTSLDQQQLDAFLEMNRLLITFATALLGGLGFFLGRAREQFLVWRQLWPALFSAVFAGCSLYFGYIAYQGILWMLQSNFFDLNNPAITWARHYHFYSLLASVFFFMDFLISQTSQEDRRERVQNAAA